MKNQIWLRILASANMIFGIFFGLTWSRTGYCFGDAVFSALELPAWSNGSSGTHYATFAGIAIALAGLGLLSTTLSKKTCIWLWSIIAAFITIFVMTMCLYVG